jgi:hypothetical protein
VPLKEFVDDVRLRLLQFELLVFKNCAGKSDGIDDDARLLGHDTDNSDDIGGNNMSRFDDADKRLDDDKGYCDDRRHIVLRRCENDAARRCNSICEQTTLSNVKEFFPFLCDVVAILFKRWKCSIEAR